MTTSGTPWRSVAACTTETTLPPADWASNLPSPESTRSAPATAASRPVSCTNQSPPATISPPVSARSTLATPPAAPAPGTAMMASASTPSASRPDAREAVECRVQQRHLGDVGTLLRPEDRGGAAWAGEGCVDVGDEAPAGGERARIDGCDVEALERGEPAAAGGDRPPLGIRQPRAERGEDPSAAVARCRAAEQQRDLGRAAVERIEHDAPEARRGGGERLQRGVLDLGEPCGLRELDHRVRAVERPARASRAADRVDRVGHDLAAAAGQQRVQGPLTAVGHGHARDGGIRHHRADAAGGRRAGLGGGQAALERVEGDHRAQRLGLPRRHRLSP